MELLLMKPTVSQSQFGDQIEEDKTIAITKVKLRFYYGSKLTTTNESVITTTEKSIQVDWNKVDDKHGARTATTTISGTELISNVKINIYPTCANKGCKVKVYPEPGQKEIQCKKGLRKMLIKRCGLGFDCEIQMEREDRLYNLTILPKPLGKFLDVDILAKYATCPEQFELELLEIEDDITVTFNADHVIRSIRKTVELITDVNEAAE